MSWSTTPKTAKAAISIANSDFVYNTNNSPTSNEEVNFMSQQMPSLQFVNGTIQFQPTAPFNTTYIEQGEKSLAMSIAEKLISMRLKMIALDFDQTIVSVHTGGTWPDSADKLAEFVRPCFRHLLPELLKIESLCLCVVTFSSQEELIREVLRLALPNVSV